MNLQEILIDAGAGFATGFAFGLAGMTEKYEEKVDLLALVPESKRGKVTNEEIKNLKEHLKISRATLPLAIGATYALLSSTFYNSNSVFSGFALATPAAYAGRFIGSRIRKVAKRKEFEDQKNMIIANTDLDNLYKHILPEANQKILEQCFTDIENKILEGADLDKFIYSDKSSFKNAYEAITKNPSKYTPILLMWSLDKQRKIIEHASIQRDITDFYEAHYPERIGPAEVADSAIIGKPENTKVKVFTKEGGDFYIQTAEWATLKTFRNDKNGFRGASGSPTITSTPREIWTNDYKALTDKLIFERDKGRYSTMLMKVPTGMSDKLKEGVISASFLPAYEKYHRGSSGTNSVAPK